MSEFKPSFSNEEMNTIVDSFGGRKLFTELVINPLYIKSGHYTKEESANPKRRINKNIGLLFLEYSLMINSSLLGYNFSDEEKNKKWENIVFLSKFKDKKYDCVIYKSNKYVNIDKIWYIYINDDLKDLDAFGRKVILAYDMDNEGLLD